MVRYNVLKSGTLVERIHVGVTYRVFAAVECNVIRKAVASICNNRSLDVNVWATVLV